ncbi:glycosyltransferase [Scytonema sp. HK-05]|uniref:glycosyltransferase n=1 Tax=Scytonema sp. HK-05 TaxID=1137095 RepID=UPI001301046D|nr:glycosyltransferase [Scytonema sp. HK-05]
MKTKPPTQGAIYCAVDAWSYLESAVISAFALRQVSPKLPIIILSNIKKTGLQEQLSELDIVIKPIVIPEKERLSHVMVSRLIKTSLHTFTEFDETLYLDADILPLKPIDEIWRFLEFENIAMALDPYPTISQCCHIDEVEKTYTLKTCAADSVHFNSGVMLWRNTSDAHTLFETWQKEWRIFKQQDQLALCRAVQETKTKIAHLPSTYNYPIPLLVNISQIEDIEQINKLKPDLPQLNDIKLVHCFKSITLYSQIFKEVARRLMPDATEKALRCLKSISECEFDVELVS